MAENLWKSTQTIDIPEEAIRQTLENEETFSTKLYTFVQKSPFLVAGGVGLTVICGIGAYKWKYRTIPATLYLTQLRVIAQGTALAFITTGMVYNMYNDYVVKKKD